MGSDERPSPLLSAKIVVRLKKPIAAPAERPETSSSSAEGKRTRSMRIHPFALRQPVTAHAKYDVTILHDAGAAAP
jgi:hypothetical protein